MNPYISFKEIKPKEVIKTSSTEVMRKGPYNQVIRIEKEEQDEGHYESVFLETVIWRRQIVEPKKGKITLVFEQETDDLLGYELETDDCKTIFFSLSGKNVSDYEEVYSYAQGILLFKMNDGRLLAWQGYPKDHYSQSIIVKQGEEYHMYLVKHEEPGNEKMDYNEPYFYLKDSEGKETLWRLRNQMFPIISTQKIPYQNFFKTVECDKTPIKNNLEYYFNRLHEANYG